MNALLIIIKMIDGIIYKLYSKDDDEFYVGSTTNFYNRKKDHKSSCNNENDPCYNNKKYQYIRNNGGYDKFDYEILELGEYENEYCMRDRERYFIETLKPSLNSDIPNRTQKEYYEDNKEKKKEYRENNKEKINERDRKYYENNKEKKKEYYENNKEKINEYKNVKIECKFCGSIVRKSDISRHQKSKKCLLAQSQRTNITLTTT